MVYMVWQMVENRACIIIIIIVFVCYLEKEASSKELSMTIQLGGITVVKLISAVGKKW